MNKTSIVFLLLSLTPVLAKYNVQFPNPCECACTKNIDSELCERIFSMEKIMRTVVKAIEDRTYLINKVKDLSEWMDTQKEVTENLTAEVLLLKDRLDIDILPSPSSLVRNPDDKTELESEDGSGTLENELEETSKGVSDLLSKVKEVENRTMSVQNELISERRVRRHLEENLRETQSSIRTLGDRLENVTAPMDSKVAQVEEVFLSSLESLNRTLFEDHLKKLYYKVDGIVYRNETRLLDERLIEMETELKGGIDLSTNSNFTELEEELKSLALSVKKMDESIGAELIPRIAVLETETVKEEKLETLEFRITEILNTSQDLLQRGMQQKLHNLTEEWETSLSNIKEQVLQLQTKDLGNIKYEDSILEQNETIRSYTACTTPQIQDPNLLAVMDADSSGRQTLTFGCRPIGRYVLMSVPVPPRCENGIWQGPLPTCMRLLDDAEIRILAAKLKEDKLCLDSSGTFPDPTNCSRFLSCSHGKVTVMDCPENLHFNAHKKQCVYPINSGCSPFLNINNASALILRDLIPAIAIEPNNLDKSFGLMGTGPLGQLIAYPGTTFTLKCLYPENIYGQPIWSVYYFESNTQEDKSNSKGDYSLTIPAAAEEHSGIYTCRTPYGKEHSITVLVKAVECPSITDDEELEEAVFYRPTPEGHSRILSTVAQFQCEDGRTISAMCLANASWSREAPKPEECQIRNSRRSSYWGCPPISTKHIPHLIIRRKEQDMTLIFECAGGRRLVGPSYVMCTDEKHWNHMQLPKCQ